VTEERLILVDAEDRALGPATRAACHAGEGLLHRAFSVYLFDADLRLLLQQRQDGKTLWPGFWSNSCCSHPRWGEEAPAAAARRIREELGVGATLEHLWSYRYQARFADAGSEHELCWVFAGPVDPSAVRANATEVKDWRFAAPGALDAEIDDETRYTPWFRIAWRELRARHWGAVERFAGRR